MRGGIGEKFKYLLYIWLPISLGYGQSVIIDHQCTDVSRIPVYWIEKVKQDRILIQCVGQSHARQYEYGLLLLEQQNPRFEVQFGTNLDSLNEPNCLRVLRSQYSPISNQWKDDSTDDSEYWSTETARQMTQASAAQAITAGQPIAASLWCWCWDICKPASFFSQADEFTEEHLGWYLNTILQCNQNVALSPTIFIYHTSVSDCSAYTNPDGPWRVTYMNELIRQVAADANGILIDQADIENWNTTNTVQYITLDAQGRTVYPRHPDYEESELSDTYTGDHANDALDIRKAAAIWYLAARLAGWDGCLAVLGDMNGDCRIDVADFVILSDSWLTEKDEEGWNPIADIAPASGDGVINIQDFTALSQSWMYTHCGAYFAADFNQDCRVDMEDLSLLAIAWLSEPGQPEWNSRCDIIPAGGDGKIDIQDFASLGQDWMLAYCDESFAGDFDHDCHVGWDDLTLLAAAWLSEQGQPGWDERCDIMPASGDGKVDFLDFTGLSIDWLKQQE